jgi:prepilin-type processing-associated H-X9-DG protein
MLSLSIANVIVPYFTGHTKAALLLLIPIIIIEAILLKIFLKKGWIESFKFCAVANIISTLVGILLIIAEIAAYIILSIMILLLFPGACALSIWIEYKIYKHSWKDIPYKKLLKAVIIVNIITYIPLLILATYIHSQNYNKRMEKTRRISCSSNLKQIGLALRCYAGDNKKFFPSQGFEQLRINDYLTDYGVYRCPSCYSHTPKGKDNEKITDKIVSYVYQNGLKLKNNIINIKTPIAWDKPENHENYGNVLFVDGHVKSFKGEDWMEQAGIKKGKK